MRKLEKRSLVVWSQARRRGSTPPCYYGFSRKVCYNPFVRKDLARMPKGFGEKRKMARPRGLEPLTFGSGGRRSIQLSYGRIQQELL